ncbi:hypothetical protein [Listeria valentina]|uniref:hypothetical protein n=1 Tax=Listeria valentina TaxID=2705293 RepID=UPI0014302EBC|nr:hypothetical protein [Listeria valentina]
MFYTSKAYVAVPEGNTYLEISENYHEAFEDNFIWTTDDIKQHLHVKDWWILKKFADTVKFIHINTIARQALKSFPDPKWEYLYAKRKLYQTRSYLTYVLANTTIQLPNGHTKQISRLPKEFITLTEVILQYKGLINKNSFRKKVEQQVFTKYLVFDLPRYDKQEIDDYFSSIITE